MKVVVIIPSRYNSKRFKGKPLALIKGETLLQRTYKSASLCSKIDALYIATDDDRIYDHAKNFSNVIMTREDHPNGTSRIIEVLEKNASLKNFDVVLNIQGDHPCISAKTIEAIIEPLKEKNVNMTTAATLLKNKKEIISPNNVKVVMDKFSNALYFSRSPIPFSKNFDIPYYQHIGIYGYKRDFLLSLNSLKDGFLQKTEDLEQLKILENGFSIKVVLVDEHPLNVDVKEDIYKVEKVLC